LPVKGLLELCSNGDNFCGVGVCTGPRQGITRCVQRCATVADCPGEATCEEGQHAQFYCRPNGVSFEAVSLPAAGIVASRAACSSVDGALTWAGLAGVLLWSRRARRLARCARRVA
jgi:hypothetical protein